MRRARYAIVILVLLLAAVSVGRANTEALTEYQVKAAFLFNFLKYITWPPDSAHPASGAIRIGLAGDDPFGSSLDEIVRGRSLDGRPIVVSRFTTLDSVCACDLVFVSGLPDSLQTAVLQLATGSGVVTVGESPSFIKDGGIIRLRLRDNQVRFDVNLAAANRSGLKISSRLLQLAENVVR